MCRRLGKAERVILCFFFFCFSFLNLDVCVRLSFIYLFISKIIFFNYYIFIFISEYIYN
jgi:hypothetical protein